MSTQQRFVNKVAVITGAGKGIGRASAIGFAAEGAAVVIADIDAQAGAETVRQIEAAGGRALFVQGDIADETYVKHLIAEAVRVFGGVDVLHNNAGVNKYGTVVDLAAEDWDWILGVNLRATFLTCKYAIPAMRKRGGGAIVNTASVQAFASQKTVAAYAASKGGIVSLTTTIALDHARENIRCNCIAPGSVHTPMLDEAASTFGGDRPDAMLAQWGDMHPIGRVGRPEEVALLVRFLASNDAAFITGACYRIDGGLLSNLL